MKRILILFLLGQACSAYPQATPAPTPAGEDERTMTREERIKAHHARIEKIIADNRKKQEEANKAAQTSPTPGVGGPGNYPAPNATQPGQAVPPGPVQPARLTPQVQGAPPPQVAQGARSESRTILMFRPMDSVVKVGETFETEVAADTKNGQIDQFSFHLKYPADILNPLALDHSPITSFLKDDVEYAFDPEAGEIFFRGTLKEPTRLTGKPLVKIVWEATAPTDYSTISFATNSDEMPNGLFLSGINLLGTIAGADDGFIESTIVVMAPKSRPVVQTVSSGGILIGSEQQKAPAPISLLKMEPSVTSVREGEKFYIDIVLSNEGRSPFDHIRLSLKFNPDDLEVLDGDNGNIIRDGINLEDGFADEDFPFQYRRINQADNKRGTVRYDAAMHSGSLQATGIVARLHLVAKRPVATTAVALVSDSADPKENTDVSLFGTSTLAALPGSTKVLDRVSLAIAEAPAGTRPPAAVATPANPFRSRLGNSVKFN